MTAAEIAGWLSDHLWTFILLPIVVGSGLYFTIRSGVIQLRWIPEMFRTVTDRTPLDPDGNPQSLSAFQSFTLSAASRVGVGNIAGVGTAIAIGGPGAVFWMWLMAMVGSATSLMESSLAQLFKVRGDDHSFRGGPAYYIRYGLKKPAMATLFAILLIACFPFAFNALQANTVSAAITEVAGESVAAYTPWVVAIVVVGLTAAVIFGGVHRIASVSQTAIPVVAIVYLTIGIIIVGMNIYNLPAVVTSIFTHAWGLQGVFGAALGTIIMTGVKRGMFSNEAGLGSVPNAAATAAVTHPVKQGLVQSLGVYFDTWLVCSITAFIILVSNPNLDGAQPGILLTQQALADSLGSWTSVLLAVIIFLLAFTSVLGNYYYGESNLRFISDKPRVLTGFRVLTLVAVFAGCIAGADLIWNLADGIMGLMALVNLIAVLWLSPIAFRLIKDYSQQRRAGRDPVFTRDKMPDVDGIECWVDEASVTGVIGTITADLRDEKHGKKH